MNETTNETEPVRAFDFLVSRVGSPWRGWPCRSKFGCRSSCGAPQRGEGGLVQAGGPGAKNCRPGPYADLSECNFADADLPPELTFSSGGKLTATHTQAGSYEFTVEAVNEVGIADDTGTVTIWPPRGSGGVGSGPGTGQRQPADPR